MTPRRILTRLLVQPADVQPRFENFEVIGTFNPAAINYGEGVALLIRVAERPVEQRAGNIALPYWDCEQKSIAIDWHRLSEIEQLDARVVRLKPSGHLRLTFISWLLVAFSRDGLTIDRFGEQAMHPATPYEVFGIEDPRLVKLGDRFYFTYVAVSPHGIVTALASTRDFCSFTRHGIIFCPENKDVVLFPEQIDGRYFALHRPNPNGHFSQPEIWLASSPDLIHWGRHKRLLGHEAAWATRKIGAGTPPVRTKAGWLSLYHGNIAPHRDTATSSDVGQYAAATLLLDLDNPEKIIGMSSEPMMFAEADFERSGYLPDIVFPTALLCHGDHADVYYGAADTATGVTRYAIDNLLESVRD
jgi:beta-1,2-mannobiose phosphorylase / 1,2-beta-oligomannan phosphorylase